MTNQKTPNVKRPGIRWKQELAIWGGIILFVAAVITVIYVFTKNKGSNDQENTVLVKQSGMDPEFLKVQAQAATEPEPESEPKIEPEDKAVQVIPPSPEKPTADDLFRIQRTSAVDYAAQKAARINNQRRGSVGVRVASKQSEYQAEVHYINSQEKWKEPQIKASFPVDMERVITVDRFIPAILVNEVNSELGGKVVAVIEKNVYGAHGRKVLIPAGSKAIGYYKPLDKVGQERLSIRWPRIITPEGINIHTGNGDMTDAMGRSGITGEVDRRYTERYGMSLLVSMVTAATAYSVPVRDQNQQIVVESFGRESSSLSRAILDEHLDIKPRVSIPAGSRIMITASKDIWFKPPKKKEVVVKALEDMER